jgi:hypothetical protein
MGNMCVLNVRVTSQWELWYGDYDVSTTRKITSQHGLSCHFSGIADLNLESTAWKGLASVYVERHFTSSFGTVRTCLSHSPIPKIIQINRRGVQA